jgi:hypothetical protein
MTMMRVLSDEHFVLTPVILFRLYRRPVHGGEVIIFEKGSRRSLFYCISRDLPLCETVSNRSSKNHRRITLLTSFGFLTSEFIDHIAREFLLISDITFITGIFTSTHDR